MPDNKLQTYVQLAGQTAVGLTKNLESWTGFLSTASRLYKYPFPDQLLIHAQNPQSTAVAGFDIWTKKMRRYVRRGSKGIALVHVETGIRVSGMSLMCRTPAQKTIPAIWSYGSIRRNTVM